MFAGNSERFTLYRGGPAIPQYVWSPFSAKLEARLRLGGLEYRLGVGSPTTGPRGKIPYISRDSLDGARAPEVMSDSTLIISSLIENGLLEDWNAGLSPADKAYDLALRALLEEKLYFYGVYEKWHENFYTMRDHTLAALPFPVRFIVGNIAYRNVTSFLYGQGTMRYTAQELRDFRSQIWQTINALLEESKRKSQLGESDPFWALGGDEPTEFDATLYGFVSSGFVCSAAPTTHLFIMSSPTIVDYAGRIHRRFFPDFKHWG